MENAIAGFCNVAMATLAALRPLRSDIISRRCVVLNLVTPNLHYHRNPHRSPSFIIWYQQVFFFGGGGGGGGGGGAIFVCD